MTGKIKTGLGGGLIFCMALIGNCPAGETSEFVLTNRTFRSGDFEVKMLASGVAEIYGEGRFLATTYTDLEARGVFQFSQPEITSDANNRKLKMVFRQKKDGAEMTCIRNLKPVEGALELTTELTSSAKITPFDVPVRMSAADYDNGAWQSGREGWLGGVMSVGADYFTGEDDLWREQPSETGRLSFWQKERQLGFSIGAVTNSRMRFARWWDGWWQPVKPASPKMYYTVRMYSTGSVKVQRVTQIIVPAHRTVRDIQRAAQTAQIRVSFSVKERCGYFPVGYNLPAAVKILPGKETAGAYTAEFLLLDQTDKEIEKKAVSFDVTEVKEGEAKYDFITPDKCALYWMRILVKDKSGAPLFRKEYPFAVTVNVPSPKDIPLSSPLGGQPIIKYMPQGRFVGMKWDRFWGQETDWDTIEPEKGKFNWVQTDLMVDEAIKAGNEILWCLCRTPNWASRMPKEKVYDAIAAQYPVAPQLKVNMAGLNGTRVSYYAPPTDIKDWEDFVRAIVRRYKTKVHYWQVWNEPWWDRKKYGKPVGEVMLHLLEKDGKVADVDSWGFCGYPADYAEMVKSASRIIHQEDPQGKVVAYGDYCGRDSADEFYKTGVGDYIDILSMHYFYLEYHHIRKNMPGGGWYSQKPSVTATDNIIRDLDQTHFKYTGKHVPVWNTEEGWFRCTIYSGRTGDRPLTQKECETLYGGKATRSHGVDWEAMLSERVNACWEVQSLLYSLGGGMDKVFLHCGHGISVEGGTCGYKFPTEKGIAWAAMASVLSTSRKVAYSPMGGNKEMDAVTITDLSGKKTAVIWSHTGERKISVAIPVGRGKVFDFLLRVVAKALPSFIKSKDKIFKGMDWLGSPMELKSKDGWLKIDVCEEPLYIHDLDLGDIFAGDRSFLSIKGEKDIEAIEIGKPYCGEIIVGNPYAGRGIDGVLEASVKPVGRVTLEGKVKLAPGEVKPVPFNITAEKEEEIRVEFKLKEQDLELAWLEKTYRMARHVKGTPLPKGPQGMKADGQSGGWEGIAGQKVDTADRVLVGLETPVYEKAPVRNWQGPSDLSFTVKSCWREDGLYFFVEVNDNEITPGPEPSCQWDCVEFFVDLRNAAEQAKKEKEKGAVQFSVQPSMGDQPRECKIVFAGNDGKYARAFFMGRKTKTGYMVEGRVAPVGFQLKEGALIGLDVAVDDGKEPNPENVGERKSQMVWLGTKDNWQDVSKWGKFHLAK